MKWLKSKKLWVLLAAVLILIAALLLVLLRPDRTNDTTGGTTTAAAETAENLDADMIPLPTKYIILGYPAELKADVKASCEEITGGQKLTFTTDFTGKELELFHISISTSGGDGFTIGTLEDEKAGHLQVWVSVKDYARDDFSSEDFQKLNAMQERVNDIIVQFYDDSRFVPQKP